MTITIMLDDDLIARLENRAKEQQLSLEQFAISILTAAVEESESVTPQEVVTKIQATAANPAQVRAATANLADVLSAAPGDPGFDLDGWNRQCSAVEAELKAITLANDLAEGRGR